MVSGNESGKEDLGAPRVSPGRKPEQSSRGRPVWPDGGAQKVRPGRGSLRVATYPSLLGTVLVYSHCFRVIGYIPFGSQKVSLLVQ